MRSDLSLTPPGNGLPNTPGLLAGGFLTAQVVAPDAGVEAARAALERAFNLPSANPPPPAGLGARAAQMIGNFARLGLAFVAGRYLTSEGELNLAKDLGQIGRSVTMQDMHDASAAMEAMGWTGEGMGDDWTADQRTRFIEGAAELQRLRADGTIGSDTFSQAMNDLFQGVAQGGNSSGQVYGPPLPSEDTTVTFPTPSPAPTPTGNPPPLVGPAPAPRFDGDELAARIQEFLPRSGPNLPEIYGTNGGDAARQAAAEWNRQSDTTVAVALNVRYWDPYTKQETNSWVLYTDVDPSAARNLARNIDETAQFNVTNRDTALADSGLSEAGLLDRAGDIAFLGSLPSIGGRSMEPVLNEAGYVSSRSTIRSNNGIDLAAGRLDEIDLIIPGDGDRSAFLQDVTRGQAAALLNAFRDSGLLRDGVTLEGVIAANGLGSVLDTDAQGRAVVVPAAPQAPVSGAQPVEALRSPDEIDREITRRLTPEEQEFWREYSEAHPDVATLIRDAAHDADEASMAEAARALMRGAYGQDVVAWLRGGGLGSGMVPPGGRIPGAAVGGAPEPDPRDLRNLLGYASQLSEDQMARLPEGIRDILHGNIELGLQNGIFDANERIAANAALGRLERVGVSEAGVLAERLPPPGEPPFTETRMRYGISISTKAVGNVAIWVQQGGRRTVTPDELARNSAPIREALAQFDRNDPQASFQRIADAVQQVGQSLGVPLGFSAEVDLGIPFLFSVPGTLGEFLWGQKTEEYVEFGNLDRLLQQRAIVRDPNAPRRQQLQLNADLNPQTGRMRLNEDLTLTIGSRASFSLSSQAFSALLEFIPGAPEIEGAIESVVNTVGGGARTREWTITLPAGTELDAGFVNSLNRGLNDIRRRALWNDADSPIARTAVQIPFYGQDRIVFDGQRLPEGMRSLEELIPESRRDDHTTFTTVGARLSVPFVMGTSAASRLQRVAVSSSSPIPQNQPLLDPGLYSRLDFRELARPELQRGPDGSTFAILRTKTEARVGSDWTEGLVGIAGTGRQVTLAIPQEMVAELNGEAPLSLESYEAIRDWLTIVQLVGSAQDAGRAGVIQTQFDGVSPGRVMPQSLRDSLIDFMGNRSAPLPPMPGAMPPPPTDPTLSIGPGRVSVPQWLDGVIEGRTAALPEGGRAELELLLDTEAARPGVTRLQRDAIERFRRERLDNLQDGQPVSPADLAALRDLLRFLDQ